MSKLEMRTIPAEGLEIRAEQDSKEKKISGYGIVYDRETKLWGDMYEIIRPGAATKVLAAKPDIKCALNHNRSFLFGRTKSGTASITEDNKGVRYEATPPDAQWAKDAMASIERGDIDGSSFTFAVEPEHEKSPSAKTEPTCAKLPNYPESARWDPSPTRPMRTPPLRPGPKLNMNL